jgi:hypothetical protein
MDGGGKHCSLACRVVDTERRFPGLFWSHVKQGTPDECWPWTASMKSGYGQVRKGTKTLWAHRVAYELTYGPLPKGLCTLHRCDNRPCCNPLHLWSGTKADNTADMISKGRSRFSKNPNGPRRPCHKLEPSDVLAIRARYTQGNITQQVLADEYGVAIMTINHVILRRTWKHL